MPAIEAESSRVRDGAPQRPRNWSRAKTALGICALVFVGAIAVDAIRNGPEAKRIEEDLSAELSQIPPPDGAQLVSTTAGSKPRQAHAGRTYRCSINQTTVAEYYDRQLRRRGWSLASNYASPREYRKGAYQATLEFRRDADWDFGIDLAWRASW